MRDPLNQAPPPCNAYNCTRPHPHPHHVTLSYYLTLNPSTNRFEFDTPRWYRDLAESLHLNMTPSSKALATLNELCANAKSIH